MLRWTRLPDGTPKCEEIIRQCIECRQNLGDHALGDICMDCMQRHSELALSQIPAAFQIVKVLLEIGGNQ